MKKQSFGSAHGRAARIVRNSSLHSRDYTFPLLSIIPSFAVASILSIMIPLQYAADRPALFCVLSATVFMASLLVANIVSLEERPAELFALIYLVFYYAIPGIFHLSIGRFPFFDQVFGSDDTFRGGLIVLAFAISLAIGYAFPRNHTIKRRALSLPQIHIGLWFLIGLASISALEMGRSYFQTSRGDMDLDDVVLSPIQNIAATLARQLPFIVALVAGCLMRRKGHRSGFALLVVSCLMFLVLNNPLAIPRSLIASYIIAAVITFFRLNPPIKMFITASLVSVQVSLFPMLSALQRGDIKDLLSQSPFALYVGNGDYDGLQSTISVGKYAAVTGYKLGHNLLSAVLFFVPRQMWPDKSIGTGGEAGMFMNYSFINLSSPLPSEFYVDFGFFGVVLGGFLFGVILRSWDLFIRSARGLNYNVNIVPFACVIGWIFIILRGSLVGTLGPIVVAFVISRLLVRLGTENAS